MVDRRNTPVEDLIRSQVQREEEFIDQRSSHFKLCQKGNIPKSLAFFHREGGAGSTP